VLGARPCPRVSSHVFDPSFNALPIVSFRGWPKQQDRCHATRIGPAKDFKNRRSLDPVASIPPHAGRRVRISDATTGDFSLFPALWGCSPGVDSNFPGPLPSTAERAHGQSRAGACSLCDARFGARCIIWQGSTLWRPHSGFRLGFPTRPGNQAPFAKALQRTPRSRYRQCPFPDLITHRALH
jgi:hypothetical protein